MSIKTRVLLVEDEEDAREILSLYLANIFDEVQVAIDGKDGFYKYLKYYEENKIFDLVLSDIKMPNLNGLEMITKITLINENQKFIIISAHKDEEYLFQSISLNVISYFVKPLDINNIMDILKKVKVKILVDKNLNDEIFQINEIYSYNMKNNLLYENDKLVNLSNKETFLLQALIKNIEIIKTKENLKTFIWKDKNIPDVTLRTLIKRVKDKIIKKDFIASKKGKGYIIETI